MNTDRRSAEYFLNNVELSYLGSSLNMGGTPDLHFLATFEGREYRSYWYPGMGSMRDFDTPPVAWLLDMLGNYIPQDTLGSIVETDAVELQTVLDFFGATVNDFMFHWENGEFLMALEEEGLA